MRGHTLFVGIGSPHGDDQVGWLVVDEVSKCFDDIECRQARTPAELLDWLEGVDELVLCDAMTSNRAAGSVACWTWPTAELACVSFRGSHDLSLTATLELAASLNRLPDSVRIWGVAIDGARPGDGVSRAIAAQVPGIAKRIAQEHGHA